MTEVRDDPPGLQNERTALAWRRTALACLVVGALLGRHIGETAGVVVFLAVAAGAGAVDLHAHRRYRHRTALLAAEEPVAAPGDVVALSALALVLSSAALVSVLAP